MLFGKKEKSSDEPSALEIENFKLREEVDFLKVKIGEYVAQIQTQEAELISVRDERHKAAEALVIQEVDDALRVKIPPALHEEKREKWLKIRLRSADEFKDFVADLPDMYFHKQLIKGGGALRSSKSALSKALKDADDAAC